MTSEYMKSYHWLRVMRRVYTRAVSIVWHKLWCSFMLNSTTILRTHFLHIVWCLLMLCNETNVIFFPSTSWLALLYIRYVKVLSSFQNVCPLILDKNLNQYFFSQQNIKSLVFKNIISVVHLPTLLVYCNNKQSLIILLTCFWW